VTLEFSNTTPLPAKIYANEGACQFLFLQGNEPCEVSYRDRPASIRASAASPCRKSERRRPWTEFASAAAAAQGHQIRISRRQERGAAADGGLLLSDGDAHPAQRAAPGRHQHDDAAAAPARRGDRSATAGENGHSHGTTLVLKAAKITSPRRPTTWCARCAPRSGAGPAAGAHAARPGLAARRLRHRHAARRPAPPA
jgi:hypothetical protein